MMTWSSWTFPPLIVHFIMHCSSLTYTGMTSAARSVIRALTSAGLSVAELLKLPVAAQVKEGNKLGVAAGVPLTADDVREDGLQLAMYTHFSPSAGGESARSQWMKSRCR